MTLIEIDNLINKYNMDDDEIKLLKDLYDSSVINENNEMIINDTIDEYKNISNKIVEYVNNNNLLDLKNILKNIYYPFTTNGWIDVPDNLYTEIELLDQQNIRDRYRFNIMTHITDDIPSDPELD